MAKRPNLTDITNILNSSTTLNNNWDEIYTAFDNTLSRDGSTPNQMEADLDMNSNDILNTRDVSVTRNLTVQGVDVVDLLAGVGPGTVFNTTNRFSGDGSTISFTLTKDPVSRANTQVYIDGVYQQKDTYTVSSTTLTFTEAPPLGTDNVEVNIQESTSTGTPSASGISTSDGQDVQAKFNQMHYDTRAAFVADVAAGKSWDNGDVVTAGGLQYEIDSAATAITDLVGVKPFGYVLIDHFGENTTPGTTDMSSALTAAFAYVDVVYGSGVYNLVSAVAGGGKMLNLDGSLVGASITGDNFVLNLSDGAYHSPHKVFGFQAKESTTDVRTLTHTGTRSSQAYIMETVGSGNNGPSNADIPLVVEVSKKDYLTSVVQGEIDAQYNIVRQGSVGDSGGILTDARKVKGGSGGMVGSETLTAWIDSSGAIIDHVQTINGFAEGAGGFTGNKVAGFVAEPRKGAVHSGFAAVGRSDIPASFDWAFYAATSRTPSDRMFAVSGSNGQVHIGPSASEYTLRNTSGDFAVHNQAGTNILTVTGAGRTQCADGIELSSDSNPIRKAFTASVSLDFLSIAAHSNQQLTATVTGATPGDFVSVSPINDLFSSNLVFTGRVTSANTVTVACQNISASAIDPAPQSLRILVLRFG